RPPGSERRLSRRHEGRGELVPKDYDARFVPRQLSGTVAVDRETGVVVRADVDATLQVVTEGGSQGNLQLSVHHELRRAEPHAFDVAGAEELPPSAPVELEPLSFLKELTRTTTVIGGDVEP
ncbi:MAG: hypothetical protein HC923_13570, partial [Myxococcales bacterium]|nr:hypothetical protein [Myxococcales bacterium]